MHQMHEPPLWSQNKLRSIHNFKFYGARLGLVYELFFNVAKVANLPPLDLSWQDLWGGLSMYYVSYVVKCVIS